jgi:tRNA threonylcarbamoyladenosine modification (KEOPS) complex  Pcc1 subunit
MREEFPYSLDVTVRGDRRALETALRTLEPEMGDSDRTQAAISLDDDTLRLTIRATDPTALRAGMNSYLRWLSEALEVHELADRAQHG